VARSNHQSNIILLVLLAVESNKPEPYGVSTLGIPYFTDMQTASIQQFNRVAAGWCLQVCSDAHYSDISAMYSALRIYKLKRITGRSRTELCF